MLPYSIYQTITKTSTKCLGKRPFVKEHGNEWSDRKTMIADFQGATSIYLRLYLENSSVFDSVSCQHSSCLVESMPRPAETGRSMASLSDFSTKHPPICFFPFKPLQDQPGRHVRKVILPLGCLAAQPEVLTIFTTMSSTISNGGQTASPYFAEVTRGGGAKVVSRSIVRKYSTAYTAPA